jgi:hypothetical protein
VGELSTVECGIVAWADWRCIAPEQHPHSRSIAHAGFPSRYICDVGWQVLAPQFDADISM